MIKRRSLAILGGITPNAITYGRIGFIPVFVAALLTRLQHHGEIIAFGIFALMAASDGLDGYLARTRGRVTTLGVFLDPLADKLLITSALVVLVQLRELAAWVVVIIISREFAVTGLRVMAATRGVVLAANWWGKAKTASQIALVLSAIPHNTPRNLVLALTALAVVTTVASGIEYFWSGRRFLSEPPHDPPIRL